MSTTYTVNGRPIQVDDFQSTSVQVQNTGAVPLFIEPLGRTVAVGATVTVPGWSTRRTRVRTAGQDGTAVVTLTAGSPAAGPGPGGVTFDPGPAASMSLSISGGTWYTNEGLTSAVSFPLTVTAATVLYPSAPASITITATVGTVAMVRGMNVTDGSSEAFTWTPTTDAERAAADVSAGSGSYGPITGRYHSWSEIPIPFVIPHRGAGEFIAPQNTVDAFRTGQSLGFGAIDGGDYRQLLDGSLANMHDRDMRTTTLNGLGVNVDDLSGQAWRQVVINAGSWFGGNWGNLSANTARQIFAEFGNKLLMTPESKNDSGINASANLIQAISDYGMKRTAMLCSLTLADCTAAIAAGIVSVCYLIPGAATPVATNTALLAGTGITYVGLDASLASNATISAYIAAGYKVILYTVSRQKDKAIFDALGVSGYWSNDPLYFAGDVTKYRKTTAPWVKSGTFYHGHQSPTNAVDSNRGTFVGTAGAYRWQQTVDSYILQGWASPVANAATSYTITDPMTFDTVIGDTSRHSDMFVCQATDDAYNNQGSAETWANGYFCLLRATGALSAYKVTAGVAALIGTSTSPTAIVSGGTATLTCAVTPTTVTFSRSDIGGANNTVTITDSAFRGGYFYIGTQGATAGQRVSHGAVTIS